MAPLSVDPAALDGAGVTLTDVGKDIGWTMSTLAGTLSGCGGMCGDDPVGAAIGKSYDSAAASLLRAFAASRNGLVNLGDGVRMSAHNYSMAESLSDGRGRAEPLPVPAASGAIAAGDSPTSVGGGIPAPAGFGWVSKYIGMIWPAADSAQLRTAAGAWMAAGTNLLATQATAAPALGIIGGQQIPEAEAMGQAFADSLKSASDVMLHSNAIAAKLISYADQVDEVHAAIIDLLARICDPMTGAKIIWDFLTDDEESEIKEIAEDIKTVVDNFATQVNALMAELEPMVAAAATIAESMLKLADKEWEQFLQGNPVGQLIDDMAQATKGFGLQAWELVEGAWTYSPQRAVVDPQGSLDSYRQLVSGMAPLVVPALIRARLTVNWCRWGPALRRPPMVRRPVEVLRRRMIRAAARDWARAVRTEVVRSREEQMMAMRQHTMTFPQTEARCIKRPLIRCTQRLRAATDGTGSTISLTIPPTVNRYPSTGQAILTRTSTVSTQRCATSSPTRKRPLVGMPTGIRSLSRTTNSGTTKSRTMGSTTTTIHPTMAPSEVLVLSTTLWTLSSGTTTPPWIGWEVLMVSTWRSWKTGCQDPSNPEVSRLNP